jgi:2-oxo-4-hydroxy-4-carboxy--5-ureidoimidazoline (OHCU) decarboxylase
MTTLEEALEGDTPLARKVRAEAGGTYRTAPQLIAQMRAALPTLTDEEKVATLNAHPRIGEDLERLSARSLKEQGEDRLPDDLLTELRRLNDDYERRFGFRFVVFVNRRPKKDIVKVLQARLRRTREEELQEGLRAIVAIAEDRLRS